MPGTLAFHEVAISPVTLTATGEMVSLAKARVPCALEHLTAEVTLELAMIPAGVYWMGSLQGIGEASEWPQHRVRLTSFLLGRTLVTQAQWEVLMGKCPSRFHGADLPVDGVSWEQAQRFCARLAKKTGRPYRLPAETEWEYACRAGTTTAFHLGETLSTEVANYNGEHTYLQGPRGVYRHTTTVGATFPPNPFGLYDMHGNLWEWCADGWHEDYAGAPSGNQPWPAQKGETGGVLRGGCWHDTPAVCRSSTRLRYEANEGDELTGFRVALTL